MQKHYRITEHIPFTNSEWVRIESKAITQYIVGWSNYQTVVKLDKTRPKPNEMLSNQ